MKTYWHSEDDFDYLIEFIRDDDNNDSGYGEFTYQNCFPETIKRKIIKEGDVSYFQPFYEFSEIVNELLAKNFIPQEAYTKAIEKMYEALEKAETFGKDWHWLKINITKQYDGRFIRDIEIKNIDSSLPEKDLREIAKLGIQMFKYMK